MTETRLATRTMMIVIFNGHHDDNDGNHGNKNEEHALSTNLM